MELMETDEEKFEKCAKSLGFKPQKLKGINRLLPYTDELDKESCEIFSQLKENLGKAILTKDINSEAFLWWLLKGGWYLNVHSFKFSKEDHVLLIKTMYEIVVTENITEELLLVSSAFLMSLTRKVKLLTPDDLQVPWRPLHQQFKRASHKRLRPSLRYYSETARKSIINTVRFLKFYFPPSATEEILEEMLPKINPANGGLGVDIMEDLNYFLPIHSWKGISMYKLWLDDILSTWESHTSSACDVAFMELLAQLACHHIGHIDWEPHMVTMFSRFLHWMNLPVNYEKGDKYSPYRGMPMSRPAAWIVSILGGGSSGQKYLSEMLSVMVSFFYPANVGRWVERINDFLYDLANLFVRRVVIERNEKHSWMDTTAKSHYLTDEDITLFVECLCPFIQQAICNVHGKDKMITAARLLAWLKPQIIIPLILDRLYDSMNSLTEPHRFTSALLFAKSVVWPMVLGHELGYPEGPDHIVPLLTAILPGIDANDTFKTLTTFSFIMTVSLHLPFVDCSDAIKDSTLTEREQDLCRASAGLEDFIVQLVDKVLILVRNAVLDDISVYAQKSNFVFLKEILAQTSLPIFKGLLRKFHDFIQNNIMENNAFLLMLASSFTSAHAEESLKMLLPPIMERILDITESVEIRKEAKLDTELMYCLQLLASLTDVDNGHVLLPYMDQLLAVFDQTLRLENVQGQSAALQSLKQVVSSLGSVAIEDSLCTNYDTLKKKNHLLVRDWGAPAQDSYIKWKVPNSEDVQCVQMVFNKFIPPIVNDIENFIDGSDACSKDELAKSLNILNHLLTCDFLLPFWEEEPLKTNGSSIITVPSSLNVVTGVKGQVTMPDGSNVRFSILKLMQRLQKKLLSCTEDDTKSLSSLISIMHTALCAKSNKEVKQAKGFKSAMVNPFAKKRSCRFFTKIELINLHHERLSMVYTPWNVTVQEALLSIVDLATSRYSKVRISAQKALGNICSNLNPVRNCLVPKLIENLQKDPIENHDLLKGTHYTICSSTFLLSSERNLDLWPALVNSGYSEKQSIINIRRHIHGLFVRDWTISLEEQVSDALFQLGPAYWANVPVPKGSQPSEEEIAQGEKNLIKRNDAKQESYHRVVDQLYLALKDGKLHWSHSVLAVTMLCALRQQNVKYPSEVVSTVLRFLIHDTLPLRTVAISFIVIALKQLKRKIVKSKIDPASMAVPNESGGFVPIVGDNRPDNSWLQYDRDARPQTLEQWNNLKFLDDPAIGFNIWPHPLMVCCPSEQPPPLEKRILCETEQAIVSFFSDKDTVGRFVFLLCAEHLTQVKLERLFFWQYLFHIIEDKSTDIFRKELEFLFLEKRDALDRCAAEIVCGLVSALKHWPFEKVEATWQWLIPMLRPVTSFSSDMIAAWSITLHCALRKQDPRRYHWLIEMLMEDPLSEDSKYLECGRLKILTAVLMTCSWRMNSIKHRLLTMIRPLLKHPFHGIRQHLVKTLPHIFFFDIEWPGALPSHSPKWQDLISTVLPDLDALKSQCAQASLEKTKDVKNGITNTNGETINSKLMSVSLSENDRESDLRAFKTIVGSIKDLFSIASYSVKPCFYDLVEICAILDNSDKNEKDAHEFLVKISRALILPPVLPNLLDAIEKTACSPFWNVRVSGLKVLQVCVLHNSILFRRQENTVQKVLSLVLRLLEDTRLEVQQMAGTVLSGLLHIKFVSDPMNLLEKMKVKAKTKLSQSKGKEILFERLCIRHGGVIALCAFVSAFPYDIPEYVPDLLSLLGSHLNDYHPIPATVRQTLNDFKRTHATDWEQHKLRFTEEQLEIFNDLVLPPMYIA